MVVRLYVAPILTSFSNIRKDVSMGAWVIQHMNTDTKSSLWFEIKFCCLHIQTSDDDSSLLSAYPCSGLKLDGGICDDGSDPECTFGVMGIHVRK